MLSFQELDVYQRTLSLVALAVELSRKLPKGNGSLSEQLRRAAFSIPLNIAEGAGRTTRADAARHYSIARGSAMECAAIFDVALMLGAISPDPHREATELLGRIIAMLTKLSR